MTKSVPMIPGSSAEQCQTDLPGPQGSEAELRFDDPPGELRPQSSPYQGSRQSGSASVSRGRTRGVGV
jgi:hypothetical protein